MFAKAEVASAAVWIRTLSSFEIPEEVVEEDAEKKIIVKYTPVVISVGIVPWNYPLQLACEKIAPSVVTGNPIIIKPSPSTPYRDLKPGELPQQFFPPGVVQVISGDDNLGPWL